MRVPRRRFVVSTAAMLIAAALATPAAAQDKLKVVATFSILADIARNVGGDRVDIIALVGPNSDAHVYTPTPADARTVSAARVIVTNGLGYEGWMSRLVTASGAKAAIVVASNGVKARQSTDSHGHCRRRSACLAVGRQREDLCGEYPRRAHQGRSRRQDGL